jgi:hypothetical protein
MIVVSKSKGVNRLSVFAGVVGSVYSFYAFPGQESLEFRLINIVVYFIPPWLAVRLIAWVAAGFLADRKKGQPQ